MGKSLACGALLGNDRLGDGGLGQAALPTATELYHYPHLKQAGGDGKSVCWLTTRKVMMKRLAFLLTGIFAVLLVGLVGGCGKLNDQPAAGEKTAAGGELKVGETNSLQTVVAPDGTVYTGELKDGKPNGQGTLTDAKGSYQKGEWRNGNAYRISGTCVLPDGTKETGTWNDDGTTCGGTIWYADGRIYKGDWVIVEGRADLPYGTGAMTWPDGRQYAGHFINGKMDGVGKMTYPGGKSEDGTWKQDAFVGPAK
jgi:hypothetical protein